MENAKRGEMMRFRKSDEKKIKKALREAIARPLTVVVYGPSGNGKTSLINSIFNQNFETDDARPCTDEPNRYEFGDGTKNLTFIDMPGQGEAKSIDDGREALWKEYAQNADVVLLVLSALSRSVDRDLEWFKHLVGDEAMEKAIIACNKADLLDVQDGWLYALSGDEVNIVGHESIKELIQRKFEYVTERSMDVFGRDVPVVFCSAKTCFQLVDLCKEIQKRLPSEASLSFSQFIDSGMLSKIPRSSSQTFVHRVFIDGDEPKKIFDSSMFR